MKRMQLRISAPALEPSIAFYTMLLGQEPAVIENDVAVWRLDTPRLDLVLTTGDQDPGLESVSLVADTSADLAAIQRGLGEANLARRLTGEADPGLSAANAALAIDPSGLTWEAGQSRPAIEIARAFGQNGASHPRDEADRVRAYHASQAGVEPVQVLFLCTGNSARSIMAEAVMNRLGDGKFIAHSAGSMPKGKVHPGALAILKRFNYPLDTLRSKSWEEFTHGEVAKLDFVFTLCDRAAQEVCPIWPGQPMTAHWGLPDPAAETSSDALSAIAFADAYRMLERRIGIFVNLPIADLSRLSLQRRISRIGRT